MDPRRAERVCTALAARLRQAHPGLGCDVVIAPALGGVVLGHELARQLGALSMFVERVDGCFALRRGFALEPGARVVMAEDVVTTGLSSRECIACVEAAGGDVVAAACLVDRSGGKADLGVPLTALATLELPVYRPEDLPPELAAQPAVKPGSRQSAAP
jgi:orotate phosphoribosyltransferase